MESKEKSQEQPQVELLSAITTDPAWKPSHREEVICALWFIVAFVALNAGVPRGVFIAFFVKAGLDLLCVLKCVFREWQEESARP